MARLEVYARNYLRERVPTKTPSSSIDELFGMDSEWLSDDDGDKSGCGDHGDNGGGDNYGSGAVRPCSSKKEVTSPLQRLPLDDDFMDGPSAADASTVDLTGIITVWT